MIYKMFSIFDSKTNCFSKPFYCLTIGEAERTFADAALDEASPFYRHPEDYFLYSVGEFHDDTTDLDSFPPLALGSAAELTNRVNSGHSLRPVNGGPHEKSSETTVGDVA